MTNASHRGMLYIRGVDSQDRSSRHALRGIFAVCVLLSASAAWAGVVTLKSDYTMSALDTTDNTLLWPDGAYWSDGNAPSSASDYQVKDGLTLGFWKAGSSIVKKIPFAFKGNSLTLGEVGGAKGNMAISAHGDFKPSFPGGVTFANGKFTYDRGSYQTLQVAGLMTFTSPKSNPFVISPQDSFLTFGSDGKSGFTADENTGIVIDSEGKGEISKVMFYAGFNDFKGDVEVKNGGFQLFFTGDDTFPGAVRVTGKDAFWGMGAYNLAINLKSLSLSDGAGVSVPSPSSAKKASITTVKTEYSQEGDHFVYFWDNPDYVFGNSNVKIREIMKVPAAYGSVLDASKFNDIRGVLKEKAAVQGMGISKQKNADGTYSLVLAYGTNVVFQTASDARPAAHNVNYGTVLTNAAAWSSGVAPDKAGPDVMYSTAGKTDLNAPHVTDCADYTFPGAGWYICNGSTVWLAGDVHRMNNFHFLSGSMMQAFGYSRTVYGDFHVNGDDPENGLVTFITRWSAPHWYYMNISGGGMVYILPWADPNNYHVDTYLLGDNSGFRGKFRMLQTSGVADAAHGGYVYPTDDHPLTIFVNEGKSLGGPMPEVTADGVTFTDYAILATYQKDVVIDEATRGFTFLGFASVNTVTNSITIKSPLCINGRLRKIGANTLALGCETTVGTGVGSNLLQVVAGTLKPMSVNCLNGVAVNFASGTKLALDAATDDADFATYGFVDGCENAVTVEDVALPVSVTLPFAAVEGRKSVEQAICTVPDAVAQSLKSKFVLDRARGYSCKVDTRPATGEHFGLTTVFATFEPKGITIIVR